MHIPNIISTEQFRFVNYTLLSETDSKKILEMRNLPTISCWMENCNIISWDGHNTFVQSLRNLNDKVYYGVYWGGVIIGSQSLNPIIDNIDGESGLYLFPEYQGKGLGRQMKKEFFNFIFTHNLLQQIREKVKHNNTRNIELNKSLGFEQIGSDRTYTYFLLTKERFGLLT